MTPGGLFGSDGMLQELPDLVDELRGHLGRQTEEMANTRQAIERDQVREETIVLRDSATPQAMYGPITCQVETPLGGNLIVDHVVYSRDTAPNAAFGVELWLDEVLRGDPVMIGLIPAFSRMVTWNGPGLARPLQLPEGTALVATQASSDLGVTARLTVYGRLLLRRTDG